MTPRKQIIRGFTLIEIAVVLVLIAMLAATVAVSSGGILRGATHDEAIAQIASLDAEARVAAKRLGRPIELHVDTNTQQLVLKDSNQPTEPPLGRYAIPNGHKMGHAWQLSQGERVERDLAVIRYQPDGTAATWGVTLSSKRQGDESLKSAVAVLGMTGQIKRWESDDQVQDILAAALRRDTD